MVEHSLDLEKETTKYRKLCAESVFREMEMSNTLLNQVRVLQPLYARNLSFCHFGAAFSFYFK